MAFEYQESTMDGWHALARETDISEGQTVAFQIEGHRFLLVRSEGAVFAVGDRCSHADQDLAGGSVRNGRIVCPAHGARFDLATGEPLNPPATECIATYAVRIRDKVIEVHLPS